MTTIARSIRAHDGVLLSRGRRQLSAELLGYQATGWVSRTRAFRIARSERKKATPRRLGEPAWGTRGGVTRIVYFLAAKSLSISSSASFSLPWPASMTRAV